MMSGDKGGLRREREAWFSENASPLLSKMVQAMVLEKPDDPRAWIAGYCQQANAGVDGKLRAPGEEAGEGSKSTFHAIKGKGAAASHHAIMTQPKDDAADSEDPEDITDLNALLLPDGRFPSDVECFGVAYSKSLLTGWVKQESPCCAAASIAGAWNALGGKGRHEAGALGAEIVLRAMRAVLEEQIGSMTARFERLLGASIEPLLTALTEELAREGKRLGGRKAHKSTVATRPHLLRLTRTITMREKRKSQQQQLQQQLHPETGFIDDRYQSQVRREEEDTEKETTKTSAFEQREEGGVSTTKVVGHGWEITPLTVAATASTATTCRQTVFDRLWELYEAERAEAATNLASDMVAGAMSTAAGSAVVSSARNDTTETRSRCLTDDLSAAEAAAATATAAEQAPDSHVTATGVARKHPPPANATDTMVGTPESAGRPSSSHGETRTSTQGGVFPEWGMQPQRPSSAWAVSGGSGGRRPHRSSGLNERNVGVDSQEMMNVDHDVMAGGVTTTSATTDSTTRGARLCWESKPGPRRGDEEVGGDGSDELDDDEEGDEVEEMENDEYDDDEDTPLQDDTPTPAADETRPQQKVKTASTTGGSGRHPGRQSRVSGGDDSGRGSTEGTGRQRTRGTLKRNIRRPTTGPWKWKKDLCELLKRMGGLEKLCSSRPSTAAFGNMGIISTVRHLDSEQTEADSTQVTANVFMGKKCRPRYLRVPVPLSERDTEVERAKQWNALKEAFMEDRQVLIFHLTNHYALIFALREWRTGSASSTTTYGGQGPSASHTPLPPNYAECGGNRTESDRSAEMGGDQAKFVRSKAAVGVDDDTSAGWTRQLLTAKRGQRPATWIEFEAARRTMLSWEGYKIIAIQRGRGTSAPPASS